MEFWRYYRILRRWRWLIAVTMLLAIGIVALINRPRVGDYSATATMLVPPTQRFFMIPRGGSDQTNHFDSVDDAMFLVRSREVADRVVRKVNQALRPGVLQSRISVEKSPFASDLIRITVTGASPAEAVTLANGVVDAAAAYDQEVKRREITLAREFLEEQAADALSNLRTAEEALLAFHQKNGVTLVSAQNSVVAGLDANIREVDLSLREIAARLSFILAQMNWQTVKDKQIADNPVAQELHTQLVQLEVAKTSELAVHTENFPTVATLEAKIRAIKDRLNTELKKVISIEQVARSPIYDSLIQTRINLETEQLALQAKREALQRLLSEAKRVIPGVARTQLEESRLARTLEVLSKQHDDLQWQVVAARLREKEVPTLGSLTVVDRADTADQAPSATKRFKLTLALVLALMGGVGLAFFLDYLDNTLKTPENAEQLLGVPTLVAIPDHNPPFEEAYRRLRISLLARETEQEDVRAIVVTGPRPRGGTSTVVANLARALAEAGRRTIVVDTDFRQPTQHVNFGVTNDKGLADILTDAAVLDDVLVKTDDPNLWVLPSGTMQLAMGHLLSSNKMKELLTALKLRGDIVLLDTPPAGAFADALAMAPLASSVLLVLDARSVPRGAEAQIKVQLERLHAKILGVVLTKVRPDVVDSYYYQDRYYARTRRHTLSRAAAAATGALALMVCLAVLAGSAERVSPIGGLPAVVQSALRWVSHLLNPNS